MGSAKRKSVKVAVIGGSTVGTALALMLQRNGIEAEVYEAHNGQKSRAGGVIGLEHTALNALARVGVPQDELVPLDSPGDSERVVNIMLSDKESPAKREECRYPGRTTTWTQIQQALMTRLHPGTYHSAHRLKAVTLDSLNGKALLLFGNGESILGDVIVFADGRNSIGRRIFDPGRKLHYAGYVAHRGLYPDCDPDVAREFVRMRAPGVSFNTWPTALDGSGRLSIDWTFYVNETVDLYVKHYGRPPTVAPYVFPHAINKHRQAWKFLDDAAERLLPGVEARMVEATALRAVAAVVDVPPPERMVWGVGNSRVVLIGDGLGVFHPNTARGANAGIEQAEDFTGVMVQHLHHGADRDAGLRRMEQRLLPPVRCTLREGPIIGASMGLGRFGHTFVELIGQTSFPR